MADKEADCDCRTAVIRAFGQLRQKKMSERAALETATAIFSFHHPEVPSPEAWKTVARWVEERSRMH